MAAECEEPEVKTMRAKLTKRDAPVYGEDCVELFIRGFGHDHYFHVIVNALGTIYDGMRSDSTWNGNIESSGSIAEDRWFVELAIPWADLGAKPEPRKPWAVMFGRERYAAGPQEITSWPFAGGPFHNTDRFGRLDFVETAPVLHSLDAGQRLLVMNPFVHDVRGGDRDTTLSIRFAPGDGGTLSVKAASSVSPGSDSEISMYPVTLRTPRKLEVELRNGDQIWFRTRFRTGIEAPVDMAHLQSAQNRIPRVAKKMSDISIKKKLMAKGENVKKLVARARSMVDEAITSRRTVNPEQWDPIAKQLETFHEETRQPVLWTRNPLYDTWPGLYPPTLDSAHTVDIVAAGREWESGALLISNLFGKDDLALRLYLGESEPLPGNAGDETGGPLTLEKMELAEAVMIYTIGRGEIAEPVVPLDASGRITVPPGETREVWVTVHTAGVQPGRYSVPLHVDPIDYVTGPQPMQVDVRVRVLDFELPTAFPIRTFNFDYGAGARDDHLRELRESRINTFFIHNVPGPDDDGNVNFSRLDPAIKKTSPHGELFLEVWFMRDTGWQTPRYDRWIQHLVTYMKGHGLEYKDWIIHIFDESMSDRFLECAKAIKGVDPGVRIFQDHMDTPERIKEFAPYIDVWCPVQHQLGYPGLAAMKATGKPVWMYECGTTPGFPPSRHRFMGWRAWHYELDGLSFWTYMPCQWNDPSRVPNYGLYYPTSTGGPIPSKRWMAWRQGLDDYLYLDAYTRELEKNGGPGEAHHLGESSEKEDINTYDQVRRKIARRLMVLKGHPDEPDFN